MFAMATDTSISFSLGKQYEPVLRLSILYVYGLSPSCIRRYKIMNLGTKQVVQRTQLSKFINLWVARVC